MLIVIVSCLRSYHNLIISVITILISTYNICYLYAKMYKLYTFMLFCIIHSLSHQELTALLTCRALFIYFGIEYSVFVKMLCWITLCVQCSGLLTHFTVIGLFQSIKNAPFHTRLVLLLKNA